MANIVNLGKKKVVELEINGVEYIAALDNYSISYFQDTNKKGLLKALEEMQDYDMTTIIQLLGYLLGALAGFLLIFT